MVDLMYWWCRQYPLTDAAQEAQVTDATAVQIYQYFQDICSWKLLQDILLQLGGPGVVVQIDESLFHQKPKIYLSPLTFNNSVNILYRIIEDIH